jgi:mannose/fructose/N-acetylgalactosamine-specific phosphotransferase system component IIB
MLKLSQSNKFKLEIKKYKSVIDKIKNESVRQKGYTLLNELQHQCNLIDEGHNPVTNTSIDPRELRENVEKIVNIRMTLNQMVKDSK